MSAPTPPPGGTPRDWRAILMRALPAILTVVAALGAGLSIGVAVDDDGDGKPDRYITRTIKPAVPVTVGVDGPDADAKPDDVIVLDREAREVAQNAATTPERFDLAGDLRGDDPTPVAQWTGPLATPNWPGCTTRILPTNWSNRTASVRAIGLHYTAGANRSGLSDMNGLTGYASSPSAGVSWHFLIDAEGNCYYSVPVSKKAWTIGNLNSETVNIEVIGTGKEGAYPASPAGQRKLAEVVRRIAQVYNLPLRLGASSNCHVTVTGVITHWQGGACAGGHVDIKPFAIASVVAAIASSSTSSSARLTAGEREHVATLELERRVAKRHGGWSKVDPSHLRNATRSKDWLRARVKLLKASKATAGRKARIARLEDVIRG